MQVCTYVCTHTYVHNYVKKTYYAFIIPINSFKNVPTYVCMQYSFKTNQILPSYDLPTHTYVP